MVAGIGVMGRGDTGLECTTNDNDLEHWPTELHEGTVVESSSRRTLLTGRGQIG